MSSLPVDLVVFDLTGTTVVDNGAMEASLKGALSRHGIAFTDADIVAMRGAGKSAAFRVVAEHSLGSGASADEVRSLALQTYETFAGLLREAYSAGPVDEIPGASATMRWLKDRGVKVAAATALSNEMMTLVLDRLGWKGSLVDGMVASEDVPRGRPSPYMVFQAMMRTGATDVRRVAVVGDTPLDLEAGINAGAGWVIGVLSGVHGMESLGRSRHTHILNSVADLPGLLEQFEQ